MSSIILQRNAFSKLFEIENNYKVDVKRDHYKLVIEVDYPQAELLLSAAQKEDESLEDSEKTVEETTKRILDIFLAPLHKKIISVQPDNRENFKIRITTFLDAALQKRYGIEFLFAKSLLIQVKRINERRN